MGLVGPEQSCSGLEGCWLLAGAMGVTASLMFQQASLGMFPEEQEQKKIHANAF